MMYINFERIYDVKNVMDLIMNENFKLLDSNVKYIKPNKKIDFSKTSKLDTIDYLNEYNNHLGDIEASYETKKNIKLIMINIELKRKEYTKEELNIFVEATMNYITEESYSLDYISVYSGNEIKIIIFDRYYYRIEKEIKIYAKKNYKNGKTKIGDLIRKEKRHLSDKVRIFNYSSNAFFEKYWEVLKYQLKQIGTKFKIMKNKKIKQYKTNNFIQTKRKDITYSKLEEWRYRKIRSINLLLRSKQLNVTNCTDEKINTLKEKISTKYSVFRFEEEVLEKL